MKPFFYLFLICFIGINFRSEAIVFPEKIKFGEVLVGDSLIKTTVIHNNSESLLILTLHSNEVAFELSANSLTVMPGDSAQLQIKFKPNQNIVFKGFVILYTNQIPGQHLMRLEGDGKLSNPYYNSTFNLYDEALKSAFKTILAQGYQSLGYNTARDQMYGNLDNKSGWVTCVYTGRQAQFSTRSGATSNNFNCEHTWPQSLFSSNEPMKSDIHHLFSTDEAANSKRDNDPFGVVNSPTWTVGGSKWAGSVFEPRNEQKGATARAMFYFALRYENYSGFLNSQESVLRNWHLQFPPQTWEKTRNDGIYSLQKNRNPLIDFPGFMDRIYSVSSSSIRPLNYRIHWQTTQTGAAIPSVEKKMFDTLSIWVCNTATGVWRIDSLFTYGICTNNFPISLNPGDCIELNIVEKDVVMRPEIILYSEKSTVYDSLRFTYVQTGGISEMHGFAKFYPNPVYGDKLIYKGASGFLTIRDILGKEVMFTDIKSDFDEIEISNLKSGLYFATIKVGNNLHTEKIVRR